jgi:formylglycine-generating enzyme required for sulfatase activity
MLLITAPNQQTFCIDETEVTHGQYAAWLATNPPLSGQPSFCSWNDSFESWCVESASDSYPQTCVDWCDAHAFCLAVGKRLCGHVAGGPVDYDAYLEPTSSQWFCACSNAGTTAYPYGPTFDSSICNVWINGPSSDVQPVTSYPLCITDDSVYDLSGNVAEWTDSCDYSTGARDVCRTRGGSYLFDDAAVSCASEYGQMRETILPSVGFRCCLGPF